MELLRDPCDSRCFHFSPPAAISAIVIFDAQTHSPVWICQHASLEASFDVGLTELLPAAGALADFGTSSEGFVEFGDAPAGLTSVLVDRLRLGEIPTGFESFAADIDAFAPGRTLVAIVLGNPTGMWRFQA